MVISKPHNSFGGIIEEDDYEIEYLLDEGENIFSTPRNESSSAIRPPSSARRQPPSSLSESQGSAYDIQMPCTSGLQKKRKYSQQEMFDYIKKQEKRRRKESKALFSVLAAYARHDNVSLPNMDFDSDSD